MGSLTIYTNTPSSPPSSSLELFRCLKLNSSPLKAFGINGVAVDHIHNTQSGPLFAGRSFSYSSHIESDARPHTSPSSPSSLLDQSSPTPALTFRASLSPVPTLQVSALTFLPPRPATSSTPKAKPLWPSRKQMADERRLPQRPLHSKRPSAEPISSLLNQMRRQAANVTTLSGRRALVFQFVSSLSPLYASAAQSYLDDHPSANLDEIGQYLLDLERVTEVGASIARDAQVARVAQAQEAAYHGSDSFARHPLDSVEREYERVSSSSSSSRDRYSRSRHGGSAPGFEGSTSPRVVRYSGGEPARPSVSPRRSRSPSFNPQVASSDSILLAPRLPTPPRMDDTLPVPAFGSPRHSVIEDHDTYLQFSPARPSLSSLLHPDGDVGGGKKDEADVRTRSREQREAAQAMIGLGLRSRSGSSGEKK